jgi:hypothetical protein
METVACKTNERGVCKARQLIADLAAASVPTERAIRGVMLRLVPDHLVVMPPSIANPATACQSNRPGPQAGFPPVFLYLGDRGMTATK